MTRPRLVLGVTHPVSLRLMDGLPTHLARVWDVHVVVGQSASEVDGATTHVVPMHREPAPTADVVALLRWIRLLARIRPEVIASGTPKAGLLGLMAAWMLGVPRRIYWMHGLRAETVHGVRRGLLLWLERLAIAASTDVLVVSPSLAEKADRLRLGPPGKFTVLGSGSSNGVDLAHYETVTRRAGIRRGLGLDPEVSTVGFVGRLTEDKGLTTLVDALTQVSANIPVQLLAVGAEETYGLRERLSRQLEQASIPHRFVDHIEDVAPFYAEMDVLCLPSRREGFGNVVLEAAACGVPAVCSNITGCRDAVVDGETGLLVPVDDSDALSQGLRRLLMDDALRARLGEGARRRVREEFDRTVVWRNFDEYLTLHRRGPNRSQLRSAK